MCMSAFLAFPAAGSAEMATLVGDSSADPAASRALGSEPSLAVSSTKTAYVRFDVSKLAPGTPVHRATLSVYVGRLLAAGSVSVHQVTGPWDEDTLTAARQPSLGAALPEPLVLTETMPFLEYLSIDVTPAVQAWLAGAPNQGFALRGDGAVDVELVSKENLTIQRAITLEIVPGDPQD
jgi:hypothetical protein